MAEVMLREVEDGDLDALFEHMRDPEGVWMAAFTAKDKGGLEVTYIVDRAVWGQGVAGRALALLLDEVPDRPLYARAASDNLGSLRVLAKAGFRAVGTERSFAQARQAEIEETVLRLD
jgi:RimJ/RimL family protein N-acetyltransferase